MTTANLTTIAFDADDTLWQNEQFFRLTQDRFRTLLGEHDRGGGLSDRLTRTMIANIEIYGFGIKGFTLSMIETAIDVSGGTVPVGVIAELLAAGREMLAHPIETLPHARETLTALSGRYRLLLVTKGDLFDQERKIAQSGLGDFFDAVEIVSDKNRAAYERIFTRHGDGPERAMMVGNSLKSDVAPAIDAGAWGVYVPHDLTWAYERIEAPAGHPRFREIATLGELPALIADIDGQAGSR